MLRLHQRDALGQGGPLSPDQPLIQFCQQPLLRSTEVLYVPAEGCAQTPVVPAAVTRDGAPGTRQDPLVEEACAGGAKGGDAAEEVGAKPPHVVVKVGHLGGVNNGEGGFFSLIHGGLGVLGPK